MAAEPTSFSIKGFKPGTPLSVLSSDKHYKRWQPVEYDNLFIFVHESGLFYLKGWVTICHKQAPTITVVECCFKTADRDDYERLKQSITGVFGRPWRDEFSEIPVPQYITKWGAGAKRVSGLYERDVRLVYFRDGPAGNDPFPYKMSVEYEDHRLGDQDDECVKKSQKSVIDLSPE